MSSFTPNDTRGLMEAYAAVHDPELRANLEEEQNFVEELSLQMIENAAYVLFSQGYDVDDVISYFDEATEDTIVEDFVNYSEGRVLLESVVVSDAYIEEQFELLNERFPGLGWLASQAGRAAKAVKGAVTGIKKSGEAYNRAKNIKQIKADKLNQWKKGSLATPMGPAAKPTAKPNLLQRAASGAKELVKRIPGAKKAAEIGGKIAKSPVGRLTGKIGSRVLPGAGAALYGMDAVDRAKKGDWGGAALSGLGAATSFAGPIAALAPAAIQMGTDALGWTGDKSKKGPTTKTQPTPKAGMVDTPKGKRYKSSSDGKHYANYNDALAARNSRRGIKPAPAPAAPSPAPAPAPASPGSNKRAPSSTTSTTSTKPKPAIGKLGSTSFERRTPTSAELKGAQSARAAGEKDPEKILQAAQEAGKKKTSTPVAPEVKATNAIAAKPSSAMSQDEIRKRRLNMEMEYDAYDVVLEYLFDNGHVDTVDEAHYVMMEMDAEMIANICEGIDFKGAAREQARRDAEQEKRDKEVPTNKERRLMKGRFRPGASSAERAEGGRDALKQKGKVPKKGGKDMFEQVIEHLISEGYAETEETAREIIANMSEGWMQSIVEEVLDEAEGSYGATPKAYSAARGTKMTAKRKPFLKKMLSRTNPANRTPDDSPRKGMTSDDRERARAGSKHGVGTRQDHDYPSEGPGGVTKSAKKLRKQKAMGEQD